jgi:hypothetical protein
MLEKELESFNRFLIKEEAIDGINAFHPYHHNHFVVKEYWAKWKKLCFIIFKNNKLALIEISLRKNPENKNETIELNLRTIISPPNYDYNKLTEIESYPHRGNTILGGKVFGIIKEKHDLCVSYSPKSIDLFTYIYFKEFNSKKIILQINKFTKNIDKNEKLVEFLIKDIQKNPKKYEKTIAYG